MNLLHRNNRNPDRAELEAMQARFAQRVAARLSEGAALTERSIDERLRFARERALEQAQRCRAASVPAASATVVAAPQGAAVLAGGSGGDGQHSSWWVRMGVVLPLIALLAGLSLIQYKHSRLRAAAVAEIDVKLLVDDLPPQAYSDPGFVEFLKTSHDQ